MQYRKLEWLTMPGIIQKRARVLHVYVLHVYTNVTRDGLKLKQSQYSNAGYYWWTKSNTVHQQICSETT